MLPDMKKKVPLIENAGIFSPVRSQLHSLLHIESMLAAMNHLFLPVLASPISKAVLE